MPPPDKCRPWVTIGCREPDCEFTTAAEFAALRHERETGHRMKWWGSDGPVKITPVPLDVFGARR